jgi:hypothetical protein
VADHTIVQGAAWSAPIIAVASAAPAAAASGTPSIVGLTGFTVQRCESVEDGDVTFQALDGTSPAAPGSQVTITLPAGLAFANGSQSAVVSVGDNGLVSVPAFRATGASGSYSITATYKETTGTVSGTVNAAPGTVVQLVRKPTNASTAPTFTETTTPITDGAAGGISGDQTANSAGSNVGIVRADKTVAYWGVPFGGSATAPLTLSYGGSTVTGLQNVRTWTSIGDATAGGVAVGSDGSSVYQLYSSGTGATTVAKVTGVTGTVVDIRSTDGYSYVLTSAGLYYWANNSSSPAAAQLVPGTSGATQLSAWANRDSTNSFGGALLLADGSVGTWTGSLGTAWNGTVTRDETAPANIVNLQARPTANYVLTTEGTLYTSGSAFSNSPGGTAWTSRADDVKTFSGWGYTNYAGGVYVRTDGTVVQFFAASAVGRVWMTEEKSSFPSGTNVTRVFSSDGTYLALTSDAHVYAWAGNLDNSGRTQPAVVPGVSNAVDLAVWGYHQPAGLFFGGGYIVTAISC